MSNIVSVKLNKKITPEDITAAFHTVVQLRFGGVIVITPFSENGNVVGWTISLEGDMESHVWLTNGRKLEWKHITYNDLQWWAVSTIMSKVVRAVDPKAKLVDEGDNKKVLPTFDHVYPTPTDWITAIHCLSSLGLVVTISQKCVIFQCKSFFSKTYPELWKAGHDPALISGADTSP